VLLRAHRVIKWPILTGQRRLWSKHAGGRLWPIGSSDTYNLLIDRRMFAFSINEMALPTQSSRPPLQKRTSSEYVSLLIVGDAAIASW
jgi:hypothetical protein